MSANGVLVVDKPSGPTSHDVVRAARRLYATRSVGHAGTLDPMASGVMLLLFGDAKKLSSYLTATDKTYETVLSFGRSTDSYDRDGETTDERPLAPGWLDPDRLREALELERLRERQLPPDLSAVKVAGRPAHRRVRAGEHVRLEPRPVCVKALELLSRADDSITLRLTVSKGYYVRALARDLSRALSVPAHLDSLKRTASGPWTLRRAVAWPASTPRELVSTAEAARSVLPVATLSEIGVDRAVKGQRLRSEDFAEAPPDTPETVAWFAEDGQLVALGRYAGEARYRVVRGMAER